MKTLTLSAILGAVIFMVLLVLYPDIMLSPGKLVQGHQEVGQQCFACHQPFGGIENNRCIACHELAAIGRDTQQIITADKKVLFHEKLDKLDCTTCHTDHAGLVPEKGTKGFDHAMLPEKVTNECMGCHQKPEDKLHRQLTDACAKCHSTTGWKMETAFNHDMVQLPARDNCAGCHENPSDAFHRSLKDNCTQCHSTTQWVPSTFEHNAYFVLDSDHNAKCATCHLNNNYTTYTCYGCHEHTVSNILQEHREEGITNLTNCVKCHKSSDEHEGGENRREKGGDGEDG